MTLHDRIARRAHEIFETRGKQHGQDWSDWFEAEREIADRSGLRENEPIMDHTEFERRFLLDYLWFGRMVLAHQNQVMNEAHRAETDPDRRRAYFLAIHTNLIQECEHVAAWLLAFRRRAETGAEIIETLLRYGPGEA